MSARRALVGLIALMLAMSTLLMASPVAAGAPQPVVPVDAIDGLGDTGGDDPGESNGDDGEEAGDGYVPPEQDCRNVPGQAAVGAAAILASYPGPMVAVEPGPKPWPTTCSADIILFLAIESPDERRPEGVDATLDELAVPQPSLESVFEVRLPAQTRTITLDQPGDPWELGGLRCDCVGTQQQASVPVISMLGSPGHAVLTAQPQPVVAVESSPVVPGSCVGISATGSGGTGPVFMAARGPSRKTRYPRPVVPAEQGPQPWNPPQRQPALVSWGEDGAVRIYDPHGAGGTFQCVWTVRLVEGTFTLTTETTPPGEEGRFEYQLSPGLLHEDAQPFRMRPDPTETAELRRGTWRAALRDVPDGWSVRESTCRERGTEFVTVAEGPRATLGIDPGDQVDCTFELELQAPRAGRWVADNRSGTISCAGISLPLPASRDTGRLSVRQGGDVLRGTGGPGKGSFTVRRERDDPFVYRGHLNLGVQGQNVRTRVTLRMVSERELRGDLQATYRAGGNRCTLARRVVMTYVGGG